VVSINGYGLVAGEAASESLVPQPTPWMQVNEVGGLHYRRRHDDKLQF
jgi:hypothetical protein